MGLSDRLMRVAPWTLGTSPRATAKEGEEVQQLLSIPPKPAKCRVFVWTMAAALALVGTTSPSGLRAERFASSYCLAIDVAYENVEPLIARFDSFAQEADLAADKSHPLVSRYTATGGSVEIVLRHGMGEFGSILSYIEIQDAVPAGLLDQLKHFVAVEVSPAYKTTLCEDIEGFAAPVIYQ